MLQFLFDQPLALEKIKWVRISLCLVVILLLALGPYDRFYVETAPWLFHAKNPFPWFPNLGIHFLTLKYAVIFFAFCSALNFQRRVTMPLFATLFLFLNFYVTCFGTSYWITNTHLNFFAIALCFEPSRVTQKNKEIASFILAFMITYIAVLYFQAGLSKCLFGGSQWFLSGDRIRIETLLYGTQFGKSLLQWPWIFQLMSVGTGVFELIAPFFFFPLKTRALIASIAILFHLGVFIVMGISFWFLWALFPALFFYDKCARPASWETYVYSVE